MNGKIETVGTLVLVQVDADLGIGCSIPAVGENTLLWIMQPARCVNDAGEVESQPMHTASE